MTGALQVTGGAATQTTQIEQARAVADVLAAMEAAKRWPRDETACEAKMETACQRQLVAERAFWSFPRGKETLTGPTIDLARTIGAVWTNFQWGISELNRDDNAGISQMIAWAWDLETNTRNSTAFLVPHYRDVKDRASGRNKRVKIADLRDIYENNANNGARRVRQMILDLLPDWYVEKAVETCQGVFEQRNRKVEDIRRDVGELLKPLGVPMARVLARVGRTDWKETTRGDLAVLRIVAKTIQRGEGTARELFPEVETRETLTVRDLTERPAAAQPLAAHVETAPPAEATTPISRRTQNALFALFAEAGLDDDENRPRRLRVCEIIADLRAPLTSTSKLTDAEGQVIEKALRLQGDQVAAYVQQLLADDDAARAADAASTEE